MTGRGVELGSLVLRCNKSNLQLFLALSATVSIPPNADNDAQLSDDQIRSMLVSNGVWVTRGIGLRLLFDVFTETDNGQIEAVASFGQVLSDTEASLWKQLDLQTHMVSHRVSSNSRDLVSLQQCSFSIEIFHARDSANLNATNVHRLFSGAHTADTRPPLGIKTIQLHEVHFAIGISDISAAQTVQDAVVAQSLSLSKEKASVRLRDCCDEVMSEEVPAEKIYGRADHQQRLGASSASFIGNSGTIGSNCNSSSCANTCADGLAVHQLLDAIFRRSICDRPQKLTKGIRVTTDKLESGLAKVAPSLFSPGHAKAMAQRSCFIPTIANSLSKKLPQSARSPSLRRKLAQIGIDSSGHCGASSNAIFESDSTDDPRVLGARLFNSLSARLWQFLQTTLMDEKAARKLKPITTFCDNGNLMEQLFEMEPNVLNDFVDQIEDCDDDFESEEDEALFKDSSAESELCESVLGLEANTDFDEEPSHDDLYDATMSQEFGLTMHESISLFDTALPVTMSPHTRTHSPFEEYLLGAPSSQLNSVHLRGTLASCAINSSESSSSSLAQLHAPFSMLPGSPCCTSVLLPNAASPCTRNEHGQSPLSINTHLELHQGPINSCTQCACVGAALRDGDASEIAEEYAEMMDAGDGTRQVYSSDDESGVMLMLAEDEGYAGSQEIAHGSLTHEEEGQGSEHGYTFARDRDDAEMDNREMLEFDKSNF